MKRWARTDDAHGVGAPERSRRMLIRPLLTAFASLLVFGAAPVAIAQPYDGAYAPDEIVIQPTYRAPTGRGAGGAKIQDVTLSRAVPFYDLDLRTRYGAEILHARVTRAAGIACDELDVRFPVTAPGSGDCYARALRNGMRDANFVIARARSY
jgi:UrcA family protein